MINNIRMWWRWNGRYIHREFSHGVKNLWKWFPTIWKDRDWDHNFIYNLLAKKLEFQADFIGKSGIHIDAKRDAERIRLVVKLIKLQQESFYAMEYMDYSETEFKFIPTKHELYEVQINEISESYDEYFAKYPRQYKIALQECGADASKTKLAIVIGTQNQQRSKDLLYRIIQENIERWWD